MFHILPKNKLQAMSQALEDKNKKSQVYKEKHAVPPNHLYPKHINIYM